MNFRSEELCARGTLFKMQTIFFTSILKKGFGAPSLFHAFHLHTKNGVKHSEVVDQIEMAMVAFAPDVVKT